MASNGKHSRLSSIETLNFEDQSKQKEAVTTMQQKVENSFHDLTILKKDEHEKIIDKT